MYRIRTLPLVLMLVSMAAHAGEKPLIVPEGPRSIEILSVKPDTVISPTADDLFHGYPVRDRLTLKDPDEMWAVITALNRDLVSPQPNIALFQPSYALILTYKKKIHHLLLCYDCGQVQRWVIDAAPTTPAEGTAPQEPALLVNETPPELFSLQTQSAEKSSKSRLDSHLNDPHR